MSERKFVIKKEGNYLVAYSPKVEGQSYGKIHVETGKFIGDTRCMIELNNYWTTEYMPKREAFYDKVLDQIKKDVNSGDVTAIDELIRMIPKPLLEGYLAED